MTPDDDVEHTRQRLLRQQETLTAADAAAGAAVTVYETQDGHIRITVSGRLRVEELYVSERLIRSPELEPLLVAAVNEAMLAARSEYLQRFRADLDPDTSGLVEAAEQFVETLREAGEQR